MADLRIENLVKTFGSGAHAVRALRGVTFDVPQGRTVALVGESGCGKSTTASIVTGLAEPTSGTVDVNGLSLTGRRRSRAERRLVQMVFQHPDQSLNRRWSVGRSIEEPLTNLTDLNTEARRRRVREVIEQVGLDESYLQRNPRSLSGGQAQRVAIARALACRPELVVLDEPTASLDQSVRAHILRLLRDLQAEQGLSYLLITHDLASVEQIAHSVVVMYLGAVVETGSKAEVIGDPQHPYTRALLRSVPGRDPRAATPLVPLAGETPSAAAHLVGCSFAGRCAAVTDRCRTVAPVPVPLGPGRSAACLLVEAG